MNEVNEWNQFMCLHCRKLVILPVTFPCGKHICYDCMEGNKQMVHCWHESCRRFSEEMTKNVSDFIDLRKWEIIKIKFTNLVASRTKESKSSETIGSTNSPGIPQAKANDEIKNIIQKMCQIPLPPVLYTYGMERNEIPTKAEKIIEIHLDDNSSDETKVANNTTQVILSCDEEPKNIDKSIHQTPPHIEEENSTPLDFNETFEKSRENSFNVINEQMIDIKDQISPLDLSKNKQSTNFVEFDEEVEILCEIINDPSSYTCTHSNDNMDKENPNTSKINEIEQNVAHNPELSDIPIESTEDGDSLSSYLFKDTDDEESDDEILILDHITNETLSNSCDENMNNSIKTESSIPPQLNQFGKIEKVNKTRERQHVCYIEGCNETFTSLSDLNSHKNIHSTMKIFYKCNKCTSSFLSVVELEKHRVKGHCSTKYKCKFKGCYKCFKTKTGLDEHKISVHAKTKHRCDICFKRYSLKHTLKKHKEKVH